MGAVAIDIVGIIVGLIDGACVLYSLRPSQLCCYAGLISRLYGVGSKKIITISPVCCHVAIKNSPTTFD